jgi:TP901 family phage tail tape measure protein
MAERIAYLEAVVGADITQFRKGMRDIRNETGILSETLQGIAGVGRSMTFALTTPIVTMGTYFAQAASEFDANMRNINSLIKLPQGSFQDLSTEVLNFGMNTRAGANEASKALYAVFSAGYGLDDTSKAMDLLEQSTRLSEAGLSDLERTTEGLTATLLTYSDGTIDATRAADVWANMVGFGVGNLEGFLQNASKAMPAANALGISFENLGANAAYLSQGFASPNKAMTALGMLESNLMKPNAALALSYEKLGVMTGQELVAKFGSLEEAIIAVRGVTNDIEFASGFSKTGMEAALMLTNNIDQTRKSMLAFYDTLDGAAMGQWQQQTQSFAYQFDRFKSALQGVAIALGNQVLPLVTPLIGYLTDGLVWFAQLNPEVHRFAVVLGGVAAAIGPVLWVFGSLIGTLTPMGILFKGIIAAISAFSSNFLGLRDTITSATSGIIGSLSPLSDTINTFYETLFPDTIEPPDTDKLTGNWVNHVDSSDFLKIDGPTNLWTIFKEQGYEDLFSWDEFRDRATKGGWDGKALNADSLININADGLGKTVETIQKTKSQMEKMLDGGLVDPKGPVIPSTFTERFREAISAALPAVLTELGNVLNGIRAWADYNIGTGLNMLAMLFSGSSDSNGNTPVFEALRMALNGDIIGAIDAVIPGAGEHLRNFLGTDFGKSIQNAFPEISIGITNLLSKAGEWFINEGVPTLSRSVGYIVGRVGVAFGEVMGSLWGNLTNGNAAKGAGNALSAIGETVVNPALEGFNDAMKDAGVENPVDQLFTALSGALVTAAGAWVIADGFKNGVFHAIKFAISGMLSFGIWAGSWALSLLGKLGAQLISKAGIDATWSGVSTAVWNGVKSAISKAPNIMTQIGSAISSSFATGGALAIGMTVAAGITVGTLLYLAIPEEVRNSINASFMTILNDIFGEGTGKHLEDTLNDVIITGIAAAMKAAGDEVGADKMLQQLSGGTALTYQPNMSINPRADGFDMGTPEGRTAFWSNYFSDIDLAAMGELDGKQIFLDLEGRYLAATSKETYAAMAEKGFSTEMWSAEVDKIFGNAQTILNDKFANSEMPAPQLQFEPLADSPYLLDIPVTDVTINTDGASVTLSDPTTLVPDNSETLVQYITPDGQIIDARLDEANGKLVDGLTTLGVTMAANMGDGTALDAEKINQEFLKPLEQNFVSTFSEGSPILVAMTTFGTSLSTQFTDYGTRLATANSNLATGLAAMSLSFVTEFDKVALAIQTGIDKITDWNLAVMGAANAPTMATGGVDGSHANGLSNVPFDGYIAELHKGERVLTKEEAQDYGTVPSAAIVSKGPKSSGETIVNQTVIFNEVMSANRTVRELQRVGYKIEKR